MDTDLSDEVLMAIFIKSRKPEVFSQIYSRHFVALSKYLTWLCQDTGLGKDLAQNIFIKLYTAPYLFDPAQNFKIWLYSIANNRWKNEQKSTVTRAKYTDLIGQYWSNTEQTEAEAEQKKHHLWSVREAISQLSQRHQEVIALKYSSNFTIQEISQILNCSEGTVKSRLFYALNRLKDQLIKKNES